MNELEPKILYEDDDIVVFDKPSGLVVNRSDTHTGFTLQDHILDKGLVDIVEPIDVQVTGDMPDALDEEYPCEFSSRSGIVHRLDKDTSGVIVVAKNEPSFKDLQSQFKDRTVEKIYKALIFDRPGHDNIEIDAPIGRNPRAQMKFAVNANGKNARTLVEVNESIELDGKTITLVTLIPRTGRTHQIRVHLAALNTPVIHDLIYDSKKQFEWSKFHFTRMMLHALSISFIHPGTKKTLLIESDLPEEFNLQNQH